MKKEIYVGKKGYIGKEGNLLFKFKAGEDDFYYVLYPLNFRFRVDGEIYTEKYRNMDDTWIRIDKETFERENTGRSIIVVYGLRNYYRMINAILDITKDLIKEELEEKGTLDNLDKEYLLHVACQQFIRYASNHLNAEPYIYAKFYEEWYKPNEIVVSEVNPLGVIKDEIKRGLLKVVIPDIIERVKAEFIEESKQKTTEIKLMR